LIEHFKNSDRKSLKLSVIIEEGIELEQKIAPRIPYLEAIDSFFKLKF